MKLKYYFDVMCPKSFTVFQLLKKYNLLRTNIEYRPIIRKKLLRRNDNMMNLVIPLEKHSELEDFRLTCSLSPAHITYVDHSKYAGNSTLFLTAIARNHPHLISDGINEVMTRFWIEQLNIETAPSFMTMSRNIGLEFRESDILVSEMEKRPNVDKMNDYLEEAVNCKQADTPWLQLHCGEDNNESHEVISSMESFLQRIPSL